MSSTGMVHPHGGREEAWPIHVQKSCKVAKIGSNTNSHCNWREPRVAKYGEIPKMLHLAVSFAVSFAKATMHETCSVPVSAACYQTDTMTRDVLVYVTQNG